MSFLILVMVEPPQSGGIDRLARYMHVAKRKPAENGSHFHARTGTRFRWAARGWHITALPPFHCEISRQTGALAVLSSAMTQ
jgi:hypothetical protein